MSSGFLTTGSTLQCPHGGMVSASPGSPQVKAGAAVLRASDTFSVGGCGLTQSPCATVEWPAPGGKTSVGGEPALRQEDVGLCKSKAGVPQGPVVVCGTQAKAEGG